MTTNDEPSGATVIPTYDRLMWPAILALRALGGSATLSAIGEELLRQGHFSQAQRALLHGTGPRPEILYRMQWALSYLKQGGVLYQPQYATYSLGAGSEVITADDMPGINALVRGRRRKGVSNAQAESPETEPDINVEDEGTQLALTADWREQLQDVLLGLSPAAFENLCRSVLAASGLSGVVVTGGPGDGGVDGFGVLRLGLLSFRVLFQSKRYSGTVGPNPVRSLQGVASGRADRGILITTGQFSEAARSEAAMNGRVPVELIDGKILCELLRQYKLGVSTKMVEQIEINTDFFASL